MNIVSFSGRKDSTAMFLLERNISIDYILFCDTGKEFDELKVEKYKGREITRLKEEK